ncbi:beta-ketoacyl synthase N-terminal-like domain-containing protein, partial [Streptomyces sp. NPDC052015]
MTRRVAVTGVGIVAPGGVGVPAFWDLLANGRTATRGITLFNPEGLRSRI